MNTAIAHITLVVLIAAALCWLVDVREWLRELRRSRTVSARVSYTGAGLAQVDSEEVVNSKEGQKQLATLAIMRSEQ